MPRCEDRGVLRQRAAVPAVTKHDACISMIMQTMRRGASSPTLSSVFWEFRFPSLGCTSFHRYRFDTQSLALCSCHFDSMCDCTDRPQSVRSESTFSTRQFVSGTPHTAMNLLRQRFECCLRTARRVSRLWHCHSLQLSMSTAIRRRSAPIMTLVAISPCGSRVVQCWGLNFVRVQQ